MLRRLLWILLAVVAIVLAVGGGALGLLVWRPELIKPTIERVASAQLGREARIEGPIRIRPGLVTTVEVEGLKIVAPDWAEEDNLVGIDRLRLGVDLAAYVRERRIHLTEISLERPIVSFERDARGQSSWPMTEAAEETREAAAEAPSAPLPQIDLLAISGGRLVYRDAASDVSLDADVATSAASAEGGPPRLSVHGQGSLGEAPIELALEVGSPTLVTSGAGPLPISGRVTLAGSRVELAGEVREPTALRGIDLTIDITSDDPRPLLALAGRKVAAPLPPFSLHAKLARPDAIYELKELTAAWGESRLEGELSFDPAAARPRLAGTLQAPLLDIPPLLPVFSAEGPAQPPPPSHGNPLAALAGYDAELKLGTGEVRLPWLSIAGTAATVRLADDRLALEGLRVAFPEGEIVGRAESGPIDQELAASLELDAKAVALGPALGSDSGYGGIVSGQLAGNAPLSSLNAILSRGRVELSADTDDLRVPQAILGDWQAVAHLEEGRLRLEPFEARLPQGRLAGRVEAGPFDQSFAAEIALDVEEVDLGALARNEEVAGFVAGRLTGTLRGANVGELLTRSRIEASAVAERLRLPQLADRIPRVTLAALIDPESELPLSIELEGKAGETPLRVTAVGGSAKALAANKGDLPLSLEATLGRNHARAHGVLFLPLSENRFDANLLLEGPDPQTVLALLELPRLELPPYKITADLNARGTRFNIDDFDGRVGDSDVAGDIALELAGDRPKVTGKLHSRRFDADDLGGLVGAQPATGPGETASGKQKAEAQQASRDNQVIPAERLETARWRNIDADLEVRADAVVVGKLPLDAFSGRIRLEDGLLRLDPMTLQVGDGRVTGTIALDGRQQQVRADTDLDLRQLSVARLMNRLDVDTAAFGTLSGQARGGAGLAGRGQSVKDILANADGEVTLVMEGGTIDRTIVAGLGFDLLRLFGSLVGATPDQVALHCTLVDLALRKGIVETRSLVIDTPIANLGGTGTIDLRSEQINLDLRARPDQTPLPTDLTGISIGGTLASPEININPVALAARGAAAATLGVLLKPFTTIVGNINEAEQRANSPCGTALTQFGAQ